MEQWKEINGYKHYYISNYGNVRREEIKTLTPRGRLMTNKAKTLTFCYDTCGYQKVTVSDYSKPQTKAGRYPRKILPISRLVAIHFLPNFNNLSEVDHINRDKNNNNYYNLRWISHGNNMLNKGIAKSNTSGYRNIAKYIRKDRNNKVSWSVQIRYDGGRCRGKCFDYTDEGLQKAIAWRDDFLKSKGVFIQ